MAEDRHDRQTCDEVEAAISRVRAKLPRTRVIMMFMSFSGNGTVNASAAAVNAISSSIRLRYRTYRSSTMNLIRLCIAASGLAIASAFVTSVNSNRVATSPLLRSSLHMVQGQGDSYKKVFVAGGSRGVGRLVVDKLVSTGANVVALVRSDESVKELSALEGVTAIRGDAMDYKTVEGAMDGCDAAITTLGGGQDADGKWIDYTGNNNVIEAAGILGVTR